MRNIPVPHTSHRIAGLGALLHRLRPGGRVPSATGPAVPPCSPAGASGRCRRRSTACRASPASPRAMPAARQGTRRYEQVETGRTGYAESVQVIYDPAKITYDSLLDIYWHHIDPTTPIRRSATTALSTARSSSTATPSSSARPRRRSAALDRSRRFRDADRDRHPAGDAVLSGRGVPPAVLQEEPGALRGLSDRLRAGRSG